MKSEKGESEAKNSESQELAKEQEKLKEEFRKDLRKN